MKYCCELCDRDLVSEPCLQRHASNYIAFYPYRFTCVECVTYELGSESKYQLVLSDYKSHPSKGTELLEEVLIIEDGPDLSYKLINDYFRLRTTVLILKRVQNASIRLFDPTELGNYPLIKLEFKDSARMINRIKTLVIFS
jgi:hypothetical protein